MPPETGQPARPVLTSWKAVAAFFDRDIRTVQRWEKEEGLPVQRHWHRRQGSIYAYVDELERWRGERAASALPEAERAPDPQTPAVFDPVERWNSRRNPVVAALAVMTIAAATTFVLTRRGEPTHDAWASPLAPDRTGLIHVAPSDPTAMLSAAGDLDGDGRDDLFFGGARGLFIVSGEDARRGGVLSTIARATIHTTENGALTPGRIDDYDGDGLADLLVGVQLFEPDTFRSSGSTYLVRGRRQWPRRLTLPSDADVVFGISIAKDIRLSPALTRQRVDLNRDGIADVTLGGADYSPNGQASAGGLFVFLGRRRWPSRLDLETAADLIVAGSQAGEGLNPLAAPGDFNGDDRPDIAAIASEQTIWNMLGSRGRAYVIFGGDRMPRAIEAGSAAGFQVNGTMPGAAGISAQLGDVNGDRIDDLIVAWPMVEASRRGRVTIWFGGRLRTGVLPADRPDVLIEGATDRDEFGASIGVLDVDDDGLQDLLVAARGRIDLIYGRRDWPRRATASDLLAVRLADDDAHLRGLPMVVADVDAI